MSTSDCLCPSSSGLSRRTLLRGLASVGALGGVLTAVEGFSGQYAFAASPAAYNGDVLVVLCCAEVSTA